MESWMVGGVQGLKQKNRMDFGKGFDFVWVRFLFNDDFDIKKQEGLWKIRNEVLGV